MGLHSHNRHRIMYIVCDFFFKTTLCIFGFLLFPKETTESNKHMRSSCYLSLPISSSEKLKIFTKYTIITLLGVTLTTYFISYNQ
jgi:hypothetical protein